MKKDDSIPSYSLGLGLSQSDSQSLVPHTTSMPDPSTAGVNYEPIIKKPAEKKPKECDGPSSKKGEATGSKVPSPCNAKEPTEHSKEALSLEAEQATDSRKPKLTKEVVPKKHDEKHLGIARTSDKLEEAGPSNALKKRQPENLPLAYCSLKVEDVDDSEPLFDSCSDKEATRAPMLTLKPGEQLEMNVINIWSSILNDRERKRDLHSKQILHIMRSKCIHHEDEYTFILINGGIAECSSDRSSQINEICFLLEGWLEANLKESSSFVLPNEQRFMITAFDAYVTLDVPIGGREIIESSKSSTDEEYNEVHAAWLKKWKIEHAALELTRMPEFILAKKDGGECFKGNFIIYLVNCFFSRPKNRYCSKSILKYIKDVNQIASLDWCKFVEELALKSEQGPSEKRAYQKAFIMRMSMRSFLSLLNEAQAEAARSMGFASFLKVNVKQIPGKFSKWLVESFDPYAACFRLLDGQKFSVTAFDLYATLGVPLGGQKQSKSPSLRWTKSMLRCMPRGSANGNSRRVPQNSLECRSSFWLKKIGARALRGTSSYTW
ncbi:LOW QUALITY PROTEIN: hypothetical protein Cgig2_023944 [Carnegiea gigantea]|uniref:Uncharacterized protein n=1 Tax=Carnegiea gigantea TaxID=171969 RepID=A0A9Q1GHC7_9CARY|nr:LOW QUALITY PROTEIN: hypothetical protein Cgig2_023944 [Carnegiea gigantea]